MYLIGLQAELVEEVLHGVWEDLVDGDLAPPVLHADVGPPFQQLPHHDLHIWFEEYGATFLILNRAPFKQTFKYGAIFKI